MGNIIVRSAGGEWGRRERGAEVGREGDEGAKMGDLQGVGCLV